MYYYKKYRCFISKIKDILSKTFNTIKLIKYSRSFKNKNYLPKFNEIYDRRILLIHGDGYTYAVSGLANKAIQENCDVIMFGHTHEFFDEEYKGIRLINPGSCFHNRDLTTPCYAIVTIEDNGTINVERVNLNR